MRPARSDCRNRGHGFRPRMADERSAHGGAVERDCRPIDRALRRPALCFGPGGDPGLARALAVGEQSRSSGRELLAAFVLGYDVAGRLAGGFTPRPLAHQNGQVSLLAAAAAGARLHGLDAAGISRAMRIATTLLLTPSYTNAVAGATTLNVAGGMSGFAAALAPELALAGFDRARRCDRGGARRTGRFRFQSRRLAGRAGCTLGNHPQLFPPIRLLQPDPPGARLPSGGACRLRPRPEQIERIDVATYRFASVMRNPDPPNYFASKYSLPHAAAVMVVRGSAGYAALDDTALQDPAIAALRHRVHMTEDPAMSAVAPRLRPARVTVTLTDGRQSTHACDSHRGDFQQPFAEPEIREKFRELAGVVLTPEGVSERRTGGRPLRRMEGASTS